MTVQITHVREWRRELWDKDVPSRPAWMVSCTEHESLGKDSEGEPWGYAQEARAKGVATRHKRAYHDG